MIYGSLKFLLHYAIQIIVRVKMANVNPLSRNGNSPTCPLGLLHTYLALAMYLPAVTISGETCR